MKYNIIKTDNYLLVVDDSEKEGDYVCYNKTVGKLTFNQDDLGQGYELQIGNNISYPIHDSLNVVKKIIFHLPLNNQPILEGVPLLPPLPSEEDDVEKMAECFIKEEVQVASTSLNRGIKLGFEEGYNKAKETYKFTEEDMKYMFECGRSYHESNAKIMFNVAMEYLSQPKMPVAFECGYGTIPCPDNKPGCLVAHYGIKTTTNSQDQTVWVGNYIY